MNEPKSILITGASSGIGEALALEYAAPGVHLALSGRDPARLDGVADRCRAAGADVIAALVDVASQHAMRAWIEEVDSDHPLDLVIANAGISAGSGTDEKGEREEQVRTIFAVNFDGVLNTIWPAIDRMRTRKSGHVAVTSSLAGMIALPGAPAYSSSKAAVKAYAEALHGALKPEGVCVTSICPGFVESRITAQNTFPMPMFMDAPKAARIIRKGLAKRRVSLVFPWPMAMLMWMVSVLPPCWRVWLLSRAPKKT